MVCSVTDLDACTCFVPYWSILPPPPCPVHGMYLGPPLSPPVRLDTTTSYELTAADLDAEIEPAGDERWGFLHNAVAHPLLVLWPRLGRWVHDRTEPVVERGWWRRMFGQRTV